MDVGFEGDNHCYYMAECNGTDETVLHCCSGGTASGQRIILAGTNFVKQASDNHTCINIYENASNIETKCRDPATGESADYTAANTRLSTTDATCTGLIDDTYCRDTNDGLPRLNADIFASATEADGLCKVNHECGDALLTVTDP